MSVEYSGRDVAQLPAAYLLLRLDASGTVERVIGGCEPVLGVSVEAVEGRSWQEVAARYAAEPAIEGLYYHWLAIAEQRVAPQYWPQFVPFRPGVTAYLSPARLYLDAGFEVRLFGGIENTLDHLIGTRAIQAAERLGQWSRQVFSGLGGPLTDRQVKELGAMLDGAQYIKHLLQDLRAEFLLPAVEAPLPHRVADLFAVDERNVATRRFITHRLGIRQHWSSAVVYCHSAVRDAVHRAIGALVAGMTLQTEIALTDARATDAHTVQVCIQYHSYEPELRVDYRIEPVPLVARAPFEPKHGIERLVAAIQSCLAPVHGRAWADPHPGSTTTARIMLELPRWQGGV